MISSPPGIDWAPAALDGADEAGVVARENEQVCGLAEAADEDVKVGHRDVRRSAVRDCESAVSEITGPAW
jgi:hypothetical protein